MPFPYPPYSFNEYERWFYENTNPSDIPENWTYLPVFWTSYHVTHNFGQNPIKIAELQRFVDGLDRGKAYFTIHQYDLGPLVDFKDLNIRCYGMSGGRIDYPIPLLCERPKFNYQMKRSLLASFIGRKTHPIRDKLFQLYQNRSKMLISDAPTPAPLYIQNLSESVFALCPRGFGKASFRMMEAIHCGAIPVYISDEFVVPYRWKGNKETAEMTYGILFHDSELENLQEYLFSFTQAEIKALQEQVQVAKCELYTYEGCQKKILLSLNG
jgi:hypothetical protein